MRSSLGGSHHRAFDRRYVPLTSRLNPMYCTQGSSQTAAIPLNTKKVLWGSTDFMCGTKRASGWTLCSFGESDTVLFGPARTRSAPRLTYSRPSSSISGPVTYLVLNIPERIRSVCGPGIHSAITPRSWTHAGRLACT